MNSFNTASACPQTNHRLDLPKLAAPPECAARSSVLKFTTIGAQFAGASELFAI